MGAQAPTQVAGQPRLILRVCTECGARLLYPRTRCPHCGSAAFTDEAASGRATLVSWSVVRRAPSEAFAAEVPYTVALVRLAEGPQMMTRIVDAEASDLREGLPVRMRFAAVGGRDLPVFAPEGTAP